MIIGSALRLIKLEQRPMHTDEAVHAIKFGSLLEQNHYQYDPSEYHGPTLNYLSLIPVWFSSAHTLTDIDESALRIVPVFAGVLLILALLFLRDSLNRPVLLLSALFTTVSPVMVFYSRYYIQEMLLVFFTFGVIISGFRYLKTRHFSWAIGTGLFLGLMHATKETSIIILGAMGLALLLLRILTDNPPQKRQRIPLGHILIGLAMALIVSALFYSSFFTNPRGILDSFLTYRNYFQKAGHHHWHEHPWFYYFKLLVGSKQSGTPLWSEAFILILSIFGIAAAAGKKCDRLGNPALIRFILFYTICLTIIYSLLPYKTPWTMLGFYHGWILLAGMGAMFLIQKKKKWIRTGVMIFVGMGTVHLCVQSCLANFKYPAHPSNPYVYGHTSKDIFTITDRINEISDWHPQGKNMFIEIIFPEHDYWPLPWYLRRFPNVGWFPRVDFDSVPGEIIIASPAVESDLIKKLYEIPEPGTRTLYLPMFESDLELRPQVEIRGYIRKDLWDAVHRKTANPI